MMVNRFLTNVDAEKIKPAIVSVLQKALYHRLGKEFDGNLPDLHHYTTLGNLLQIVESGSIWSTQVGCLNDASELMHAMRLLKVGIARRRQRSLSGVAAAFYDRMTKEIRETKDIAAAGYFVICFSQKGNDLSQWRAYGGNAGGAALTFPGKEIARRDVHAGDFFPVIYSKPMKAALIDEILSSIETLVVSKWHEVQSTDAHADIEVFLGEVLETWVTTFTILAHIFKHSAFRNEKEWRLVFRFGPDVKSQMEFVERGSMLRRHLPKYFSPPRPDGYRPLPLKGITIGPTAHPKLAKIAVGDLLIKHGYVTDLVPVKLSKIPFRPIR